GASGPNRDRRLAPAPVPRAGGGPDVSHGLRAGGAQVCPRGIWDFGPLRPAARGLPDRRRWDLHRRSGNAGWTVWPAGRAGDAPGQSPPPARSRSAPRDPGDVPAQRPDPFRTRVAAPRTTRSDHGSGSRATVGHLPAPHGRSLRPLAAARGTGLARVGAL